MLFFWKIHLPFLCSTIFPFYGWMRSLSLVEQVHPEFAWFWGRPPSFLGGEVINWGFWIGVRWEQVLFPHPLYFYEVVWDVMMIFNYFFVMSWFWHRFSFLGGNSGSTKFGITASHHLRIFWKINTFPFLPLFWLRLVLAEKKTRISPLGIFFLLHGSMAETLSTSRDKTSLLTYYLCFSILYCHDDDDDVALISSCFFLLHGILFLLKSRMILWDIIILTCFCFWVLMKGTAKESLQIHFISAALPIVLFVTTVRKSWA